MDDFDISDWEEGCLSGLLWGGAPLLLIIVLVIYFGWFH
jgi:hypothetical protein